MLTVQVLLAMRLKQMLADSLKPLLAVRRTKPQPQDDNPRLVTFLQDRRTHPFRGGCKLHPHADSPGVDSHRFAAYPLP